MPNVRPRTLFVITSSSVAMPDGKHGYWRSRRLQQLTPCSNETFLIPSSAEPRNRCSRPECSWQPCNPALDPAFATPFAFLFAARHAPVTGLEISSYAGFCPQVRPSKAPPRRAPPQRHLARRRAGRRLCLAEGRQLAGGDARAGRARPGDPRLSRRRERLLRGAAFRDAHPAGRRCSRDARPPQGGRQLRPRARWAVRLLLAASLPAGNIRWSAAAPAPARTKPSCSTATSKPRASPTGTSAASSTAPTTGSSPTPATTRAPSSTPSASATWRPGKTCPIDPRHARRHRLGERQPDAFLRAPRREPPPAARLSPRRRHAGRATSARLRGKGHRLLRRHLVDPVGQVRADRRARPSDERDAT